MNRIGTKLESLSEQKRKALVTYIVSGDPAPDSTLSSMNTLVEAGADIIELGVPFSDPMAEGRVIQLGHERALAHNTSLRGTLDIVADFRQQNRDTPVVLMGYLNPVERMGYEAFACAAHKAGVDGLLTVDLPPEENSKLDGYLVENDIENILLIAPTTSPSRIEQICDSARGFVYYVSFRGVTGANSLDTDDVAANVTAIKRCTQKPVLVGFGIKDAESAKQIGTHADGVVVGSALVELMGNQSKPKNEINADLYSLVSSMRRGLDECT